MLGVRENTRHSMTAQQPDRLPLPIDLDAYALILGRADFSDDGWQPADRGKTRQHTMLLANPADKEDIYRVASTAWKAMEMLRMPAYIAMEGPSSPLPQRLRNFTASFSDRHHNSVTLTACNGDQRVELNIIHDPRTIPLLQEGYTLRLEATSNALRLARKEIAYRLDETPLAAHADGAEEIIDRVNELKKHLMLNGIGLG